MIEYFYTFYILLHLQDKYPFSKFLERKLKIPFIKG